MSLSSKYVNVYYPGVLIIYCILRFEQHIVHGQENMHKKDCFFQ